MTTTKAQSDVQAAPAATCETVNGSEVFLLITDGRRDDLGSLRREGEPFASARATLESAVARLPSSARTALVKKLRSSSPADVEATYLHLLTYEYLARAGMSPTFEPRIQGKTPDLLFSIDGIAFIGDVFVTHSPAAAEEPLYEGSDDTIWVDNAEPQKSRAKKIGDVIQKKAAIYDKLDLPLLLFVFCGDTHALDHMSVEQALFGMTAMEADDEGLTSALQRRVVPSAALVPEFGGALHENLSGVVSMDLFWSLKRRAGQRLGLRVLENPNARVAFPRRLPGGYVVYWPNGASARPEASGDANTIVAFAPDGSLDVRVYSAENPW